MTLSTMRTANKTRNSKTSKNKALKLKRKPASVLTIVEKGSVKRRKKSTLKKSLPGRLTRSQAAKDKIEVTPETPIKKEIEEIKIEDFDVSSDDDKSTATSTATSPTVAKGPKRAKTPKRGRRKRIIPAFLHRIKTKAITKSEDDDEDEENSQPEDNCEPRCTVPGCDSRGHLSGKFPSHFTNSTCPLFHNLTPEDCEERYLKRSKRREDRTRETKQKLRKTPTKEEKSNQLMAQRKKEMQVVLSNSLSPKEKKPTKPKTSR